jgi:hypothetical protein
MKGKGLLVNVMLQLDSPRFILPDSYVSTILLTI